MNSHMYLFRMHMSTYAPAGPLMDSRCIYGLGFRVKPYIRPLGFFVGNGLNLK